MSIQAAYDAMSKLPPVLATMREYPPPPAARTFLTEALGRPERMDDIGPDHVRLVQLTYDAVQIFDDSCDQGKPNLLHRVRLDDYLRSCVGDCVSATATRDVIAYASFLTLLRLDRHVAERNARMREIFCKKPSHDRPDRDEPGQLLSF